ncbi:exonuclease SbcC [Quadrisphaera granulorum]|uniref:Nuclease SbcCD subunit C n=1 Tax=Quadrisphaera granulorum TaxID=317664 RepID=A0A316AAI9_9ACTN|nr:SMC family ATPase [Quadrisphaera granulorum]PWJ54703.1 exonuclease SbcC [Quadrisphaera granulorum]SZE96065.1 exonuclease SbcC [Quadrisphaera granulorum]
MRLHRLSVQAFGPFAGREHVDFDELSADGLFLLHGRTGAGKTSVLDAVCFALYGAVPGSRATGALDLRSHHAAPDLAPVVELELTASGRRLRVERSPSWTRPKRRGEGTTTEQARTLLAEWAPGAPDAGEDGWRPVSSRNDEASQVLTDVLGMGLPQFATVVLLPQGEFATFLRSGVSDRKALLQRLFSTDRYERAERWLATERARTTAAHEAAAARLAALADRAEQAGAEWASAVSGDDGDGDGHGGDGDGRGRPEPTPQQVLERVRDLAAATHRAALDTEARRLSASLTARDAAAREHHLQAVLERARRTAQVREQQHLLERAAPVVERQRSELAAALAAQALEGHLSALVAAQRAVDQAEHRAATAAARLSAAAGTPAPAGTADTADAGREAAGSQSPERADTSTHADVIADAGRLRERAAEHRLEQGRLAELVELEAVAAERERQARQVAAEHARWAQVQHDLSAALERTGRIHAELSARAQHAAVEAAGAEDTARELERAREALAHARTADQLTLRCDDARRAAATTAAAAMDARTRWLDARQARWEGVAVELAARLHPGSPCPVCGACEHPAPARHDDDAAHLDGSDNGNGSDNDGDDGVDSSTSDVDTSTPHDGSAAASAAAKEEAAQAASERADAAARAAEQQLAALERDAAAARGLAGGTSADDAAHQLERARADAERVRAAQATLAAARTELAALDARRAADAVALEEAAGALARLAERAEQLASSLDRDRARLDAAAGPEGLAARTARLTALADAAEALAAARDAEVAARWRAQEAEDAARRAASEAGFADLTQARAALRDAVQRQELQGAVAAHERAAAAFAAQLAELSRAGDASTATSADTSTHNRVDPVNLVDQPELALRALEEATVHRAAAETAAEDAVRAAERAASAAQQLERLEVEVVRAQEALEPLAKAAEVAADLAKCAEGAGGGNARRMKLSTYVLAARLEQVAAVASDRLEVMSDGRYRLVHTDALERRGAGSGLGLRVLDAWTGLDRDVSTLSGGETFMASLALALGLADVVRAEGGGAPVETLFVDEGFGTLDPESLEEVMGVLEQLRAGGRAVGLVSHVPELRVRVPARLEVQRTSAGSRLSTVLA